MKILIRVPLAQYSYIEFEFEGTAEEAIAEHNRIIALYKESIKNDVTENW